MKVSVRSIIVTCMGIALLTSCQAEQSKTTPVQKQEYKNKANNDAFDPNLIDWPHTNSELKPDPRLVFGRLDNGLRYIILPVEDKQGRVSMRLQFNVGANDETLEQYGAAHFLEHMAFRGFKDSKQQEFIKPLERLGVKFGADLNAFTSYKTTIFKIDLPNNKRKNIDLVLSMFENVTKDIRLVKEDFEKERGVVIAESEIRDTPRARRQKAYFSFMYPDVARYKTSIGGDIPNLKALRLEHIKSFYKANYTPDNTIIVISGAVNSDSLEKQIQNTFSKWAANEIDNVVKQKKMKIHSLGPVENFAYYAERDLSSTLSVIATHPDTLLGDSTAFQEALIKQEINKRMFSQRLRAETSKRKFVNWINLSHFYENGIRQSHAKIGGKDYHKALAYFDTERRRAIQFGFLQSEYDRAVLTLRRRREDAAKSANVISAAVSAGRLVRDYNSGRVMRNAEQNVALFDEMIENISLEDTHQEFNKMWDNDKLRLWSVSTKEHNQNEGKFFEALENSRHQELTAYEARENVVFKVPGIMPPGLIRERKKLKTMAAKGVVFENGVVLNFKKTSFDRKNISVDISLGIGAKGLSDENGQFVSIISSLGLADIKSYSKVEIERVFEGKKIRFSLFAGPERLHIFSGNLTNADLLPFFQVVTTFLMDVNFKSDQYGSKAKNAQSSLRKQANTTPIVSNTLNLGFVLTDRDTRFYNIKHRLVGRTYKTNLQNLLDPYFKTGPMEIGVSGDFDEEILLDAVINTLTASPKRAVEFIPYESSRKPPVFTKLKSIELPYKNADSKSAFHYCWPITRTFNWADYDDLRIMREVLLLKINQAVREQLGQAYISDVQLVYNGLYKNFGYICAGTQVNERHLSGVEYVIETVGNDLFSGKISRDEFKRAKEPYLSRIKKQYKNNLLWSFNLIYGQSDPEKANAYINNYKRAKKVKLKDIISIAGEVFDPDNRMMVSTMNSNNWLKTSFERKLIRAKNGDVKAQEKVASNLLRGYGADKSISEAIKWYEKAAAQDSGSAHYELADIYAKNITLPDSRDKQIEHLKMGAALKDQKAEHKLAYIYLHNFKEFPDINDEEIVDLMKRSAQQGERAAQREFAAMLVQGSIIQRDMPEAMFWLLNEKNIIDGSLDGYSLKKLRKKLTLTEQADMKAKSDEWLTAYKARTKLTNH